MSRVADSAGQPWEGRHFEPNPNAADDGSAPVAYLAAIARLRAGECSLVDVVEVVRGCRFLIPLVAVAGETGLTDTGQLVDKTQELSIITVSGPDGRPVLPVFSSVDAMRRWRPDARPVPADAVRVALAAASERTDRVVIDPRSAETLLVLPRPAVWAIAQGMPWVPAVDDPAVLEAVARPAAPHPEIWAVSIVAGDPQGRGESAEVVVRLGVEPWVAPERLREMIAELSARWAEDAVVAERIDSLAVQLVAGPRPSAEPV
ncbi:SseB family protein [Microcella sp.]|uniref:SseB family protein n=1 Tax=Microcella sp. TaxID=1913979 RepID=UPI00391BC232